MPEHQYPTVGYENPDDELLPLTRCVCGAMFKAWDVNLSIYKDDPYVMPCCGRRLYWSQHITVHEVTIEERPPAEEKCRRCGKTRAQHDPIPGYGLGCYRGEWLCWLPPVAP